MQSKIIQGLKSIGLNDDQILDLACIDSLMEAARSLHTTFKAKNIDYSIWACVGFITELRTYFS